MLYFEEIRGLKNLNDRNFYNLHAANFEFNFTLVGTEIGDSYWPESALLGLIYWGKLPIHIFTYKGYSTATFLFRFIIRPAFAYLSDKLHKVIMYEELLIVKHLMIAIGCTLLGILIVYIFIWKPFENRLNKSIYKTKNMLALIPNKVLVTIKNIDVLLGLDKNAFVFETND